MPYDPVTGKYTDEDASVEKRLTGLLNKNNDYMKQAETEGLKSANRRGLLNSSIAVDAAQQSRVSAALPIASQEADQAHSRNLQGRELEAANERLVTELGSREKLAEAERALQRELQGEQLSQQERLAIQDLEATEKRLGMEISSRERMQSVDIAAANERLAAELGSRETLAAAQRALERELQGEQLSQQERIAIQELEAAERRLGMEISSREQLQQAEFEQQEWLAQFDAQTQERLFNLDADVRRDMQSLDIESQQLIANLNVQSSELNAAAALAASLERSYSDMLSTIMNNPDIPAGDRQRYMDHANTMRVNNLALVEQMYGIELNWSNSGGGGTPGQYDENGVTVPSGLRISRNDFNNLLNNGAPWVF